MCLKQGRAFVSMSVILLVSVVVACPALAVDGVIEINQARALAGNVTPGDTPGFPVTISQPGSYRLTGNLTLAATGIDAIRVTSKDVTIDLNGFTIAGPTVCSGTPLQCSPISDFGAGIHAMQSTISVSNGIVRGMSDGVALGENGRVEKLKVESNVYFGLFMGNGAVVNSNTVNYNGSGGILIQGSGVVNGNSVSYNGTLGIQIAAGSVTSNNVNSNESTGIYGNNIVATGNSAHSNGGLGILSFDGGCSDNVASYNNGGNGNIQMSCMQLGKNVCGTTLCP